MIRLDTKALFIFGLGASWHQISKALGAKDPNSYGIFGATSATVTFATIPFFYNEQNIYLLASLLMPVGSFTRDYLDLIVPMTIVTGHLAVGYLSGRVAAKIFGNNDFSFNNPQGIMKKLFTGTVFTMLAVTPLLLASVSPRE